MPHYPGLVMDEDSPAIALARELTGANQVEAVAYGTEAGHFQSLRHSGGDLRPRLHRPGAPAGRILRAVGICRLRSLPAQGDREGERVTALRPAPALLQIFRERLKPDAEAAYGRTEERIARFCAEHECPNRYLALVAIGSPREVWWLNEFSSRAELERVTAFYAENRGVTEAMQELARGKAVLTEKPIDLLTSFRPDLTGGNEWRMGETRFAVIRAFPTPQRAPGFLFEASDGSAFAIAAAATRTEAERLSGLLGDGAALFEIRTEWSYPSDDWIARNPDLWKR